MILMSILEEGILNRRISNYDQHRKQQIRKTFGNHYVEAQVMQLRILQSPSRSLCQILSKESDIQKT